MLTLETLPRRLQQIPGKPEQLFALGNNPDIFDLPAIAIVGSRKVSAYGRQVTYQLAYELASQGFVIISGLALGVDSIAHQAALDAGGLTIAVLPSGLDQIYPASHHNLAKQITNRGGLLVSEYPTGMPPLLHHFVARNRLVSGLADGILITEAALKSGTLHTANFALEQGREVFVVPGNITSPGSQGTNLLIKTGATPVTEVRDILQSLGYESKEQGSAVGSNAQEHAILELLRSGVTDGSELQARSKLSAAEFNQTITMLEITGKVRAGSGSWVLL